jgi:hypothetical protein
VVDRLGRGSLVGDGLAVSVGVGDPLEAVPVGLGVAVGDVTEDVATGGDGALTGVEAGELAAAEVCELVGVGVADFAG